jgi:CheY-like chemotaxis protein
MAHQIAVLDDEQDILDALCDVLEMEGYLVACYDHPDVIEQKLNGLHPDLFLIDLMLPNITGIELARRLRTRGFGETPMIAISASNRMIQAATASGLFQAAIPKPFDLDEILDLVSRHVA